MSEQLRESLRNGNQEPEPEPTHKASRCCGEWLAECLRLGWRRGDLDFLEALWWKYHDHRGEWRKTRSRDARAYGFDQGRALGLQQASEIKTICLCGSTRFIDLFAVYTWELERQGYIVLGCTLLPSWYCGVPSHFGEATGTKAQCDDLHLRKIDRSDMVLVLNADGYIGESTRNEIAYAHRIGKPVHYLEGDADPLSGVPPLAALRPTTEPQ